MNYRLFGRSGLRVSELALGTMTFGTDWGWGADRDECRKMFDAYAEAGGNFVDTANNYTNGTSERIVGELVAADRDHFVVATKYSLSTRPDDPNAGGNHRKNLVRALEASLERLGTDHVDLLWVHMWDGMTPVEEVVRALDDLVRAGKVLYVGASDTPAWAAARAVTLAELRGWAAFCGLQLPWSLADRSVERELLPLAAALDLAVTPWGVLESGELTGKYLAPDGRPTRSRPEHVSPRVNQLAGEVVAVAAELGRPPAQVAIGWVRQQEPGWGTPVIPIVGARSAAQLADNLGCLDLELSAGQLARLEAASAFQRGFPRSFLESDHVRGLVFGTTFERIAAHRRAG
ncbi:MAG TPA: aldo/keto reductase [Actinomycetota bacterium]|nr:aldo/keto reductase [Actinomycetota bacterium]